MNTSRANDIKKLVDAVLTNDRKILAAMLNAGFPVDARDKDGRTALMQAATYSQTQAFHTLLEAGADPKAVDSNGGSVLHAAVVSGTPAMVKALLARGVNVNQQDGRGETPAMAALTPGVLQMLIDAGADVNSRRNDGLTALDLAEGFLEYERTASTRKMVEILKAAGARSGKTAEPRPAARQREEGDQAAAFLKAAKRGAVQKLQEGLAAGTSLECRDGAGNTAVLLAAGAGRAEAFHFLRGRGADLHAGDHFEKGIVAAAAEGGSVTIVRTLLDAAFPADGAGKADARLGKLTPLMLAAREGHAGVVRLLLAAGANVNMHYLGDMITPLSIARDNGRTAVVEILKKAGAQLKITLPEKAKAKDPLDPVRERFARTAEGSRYQRTLRLLSRLCGRPGKPPSLSKASGDWHSPPGVLCFAMSVPQIEKLGRRYKNTAYRNLSSASKNAGLLDSLCAEIRRSGFHLIFAEPWTPGRAATLLLLPTRDKYAVIAARQTDGANYGLSTGQIIAWLRRLEKTHPFILTHIDLDSVAGEFVKPVRDAGTLARKMVKFCPDLIDGETVESAVDVANWLEERQGFFFWWD